MFWACWVFDANRSGTMLWTGTGIHLGNPYSCRVVGVDCPLPSDKKIAKRKTIWIFLMAQEGTPFTDGAKGFKLQCPLLRYTAMMWLAVKCYDRMFPVGFFHPEGQDSRRNASHSREVLLYIILCWRLEVYDPNHIGTMVLARKRVPFSQYLTPLFKQRWSVNTCKYWFWERVYLT